jgi:hypothetical protein
MKKKPDKVPRNHPALIEVSKPINQMSKKEIDGFADEILVAIDGQASINSCPKCSSRSGLREISYGLPDGPVDEEKYAIGGCCISDNDPTVKCIECGWEGEYVDNMKGWKRGTKFVELEDISRMSEEEIDAYAKRAWHLLTQDNKNSEGQGVKASTDKKPYQPYRVTFNGSSLLGESNGIENFKVAYAKLSELRDKGRVECYTRWCKACTLYRLKPENDVIGHVLKISFPNVIALAKSTEIDWTWERPESDWAKKTGDPVKSFQSLVERNSKPVFYVRLESEEYINMLLGGVKGGNLAN